MMMPPLYSKLPVSHGMFYSAQGTDKPEFLDEHIYESAQSQDSWTHQYALTAMAEVYMSDELLSEDSFTYVLEEV